MMRIAFVINDISNVGGTESVTSHIANLLVKENQTVSIISIHQSKEKTFFNIDESISTISLFKTPQTFFKSYFQIGKSLARQLNAYDAVILSDTQLCIFLPVLRLFSQTRILSWEHFNSSISTRFGSRWFGRWFATKLSDDIVVLTDQDKRHWQQCYRLRAEIHRIYNPSSQPIRKNVRSSFSPQQVISVGRYTEQKGFDLLIDAWALLPQHIRNHWELKIIGPNGSAKPLVSKKIKELGLKNVQLCDSTKDMRSVYQNASLYVMSSRYEGFGLTLIEAMSSGLPCVAFDCPMGPGEILDNRFGVLVEPENVDALAKALNGLLVSSELRQHYSERAMIRARDFEERKILNEWTALLTRERGSGA